MSLAEQVVAACLRRNATIATAESCTGGMLAASITDVPGSSAVFDRGFITYSNQAKTDLLAVPAWLLSKEGAVSKEVALAMARGALQAARVDFAIAITGIAGPTGGSQEKPVGLVHIALAAQSGSIHHQEKKFGDAGRSAIRQSAVAAALHLLLEGLA